MAIARTLSDLRRIGIRDLHRACIGAVDPRCAAYDTRGDLFLRISNTGIRIE
jgi:hypothetical protein